MVSHSGYDWLLLDTEHSPNDVTDILGHLQAAQSGTASCIVRPAWNDMVLIKRYLDIGAQTLLLPFVQNAEEAKRAVESTRYPRNPLDVLAQQIVAECACEPWHEDALFDLVRRATPYRDLKREADRAMRNR